MHPLQLLAYFAGGALLVNAIPHLVSGMMGRKFPSPFAKPPGKGLSSAVVNVIWGFANLVLAYLLLCRVGQFDVHDWAQVGAAAAGMLLLGVGLASHFGAQNEGRGPDMS